MNSEMMTPRKRTLRSIPTAGMIFIILVALCVVLGIIKPAFLSAYNVMSLSRSISYKTMVAFGQTLVLLTGGIDLSVAGMAGMAGRLCSQIGGGVWFCPFPGLAGGHAGAVLCRPAHRAFFPPL